MDNETLIIYGDAVKALGEGRVGGYLVRFGNPAQTDLVGDYFTKSTDFAVDWTGSPQSATYYNHGFDPVLKHRTLGKGSMKLDDIGVWIEAQLAMRDDYEKAIYEMAKSGKLGWSSGTAAHLVDRKSAGGAYEITRWPLGLDASLTPNPAEPRNNAMTLKSWLTELGNQSVETATPQADEAATVTIGASSKSDKSDRNNSNGVTMETTEKQVAPPTEPTAAPNQALIDMIKTVSEGMKSLLGRVEAIEKQPAQVAYVQTPETKSAPNLNTKTKRGDDETKAMAHWYRTGDDGGIRSLKAVEVDGEYKASNNVALDMSNGAQGTYLIPTGQYNAIIAKLQETSLYDKVGVMRIPGSGTTVNVPIDNGSTNVFVSTAAAAAFDRDAPAVGQVAMTLVKYTKKVQMAIELLEDEDAQLLNFINTYIGNAMALTHNSLLATEILANGTAGLTFAGAAAITAAELTNLQYKLKAPYQAGAVFVMNIGTEGYMRGLTGNPFLFANTPNGTPNGVSTMLGRPIYNTDSILTMATGRKTVVYGNFNYVGMRLAQDVVVLRDIYSGAPNGLINFHYYFRTVYKVLQSEAIQYGTQA